MKSKVEVKVTKHFLREMKKMAKKFSSLKSDLSELNTNLLKHPQTGTPLGNNTYKIRLAIKSKAKGKSGGARVISYLETEIASVVKTSSHKNTTVNLISIYDKSDVSTISKEEVLSLIRNMEFL